MIGAWVAYLVRRFLGKALVAVAVLIVLLAVLGVVDWVGALYLGVLWLVVAFTHASGFDLFDRESDS